MKKGELLYEGKAKKIFTVEGRSDVLWQEFKDFMTAFNGERKEYMPRKGEINLSVSEILFKLLESHGVKTHFVQRTSPTEFVSLRLKMIPLEVVVRNIWAGSSAKKFGQKVGEPIASPLFEIYLKDDQLGDPFLSTEQAVALKILRSETDIDELKQVAFKVNEILKNFWREVGINLVDFKLEFGRLDTGELVLGDEISGDCSRLWDIKTGTVLDKDRFRKDMGEVMASYEEVLTRIENKGGA